MPAGVLDFTEWVNEVLRETYLPENLDAELAYIVEGAKPKAPTTVTSSRSVSASQLRIAIVWAGPMRPPSAPQLSSELVGATTVKRIEIVGQFFFF